MLQSYGNDIGSIHFDGDLGADVLIVGGTGIGEIVFDGGADADVLSTYGSNFGDISFEGDKGGASMMEVIS